MAHFIDFALGALALMIRATRSRSTERQRDRETEREDLIIPKAVETVSEPMAPGEAFGFLVVCKAVQIVFSPR